MNNNKNFAAITVIIFTYNHEDSIAKAIDSVLEQETTYPYEIWLCDDCSTDSTTTICIDYAKRYPDKIKLFTQPVNTYSTKITHFEIALKRVDTKYLSLLEGDDAWCGNKKIQIALDFLENNPQYITFAHDTLFNDIANRTKKSLVHEIYKAEIQNPVTFENVLYLHTSSRIYRNVVKFSDGRDFYSDLFLFYIFLDKGPLYYYDKIMSTYNITGKGAWSGLSEADLKKENDMMQYKLNVFFNYKHDVFFTSRTSDIRTLEFLKKTCGAKPGWELWYKLISEKTNEYVNQLKLISELQKEQDEISALYLSLSKDYSASEELNVEKAEENIRILYTCYLSRELPDEILSHENTFKIKAHLVTSGICLKYSQYRKAFSHLIQVGKLDLPILFSKQTLKIIAKGLLFHLS